VAHHIQYSGALPNYTHRHVLKPGITGWAQVNGLRGETPDVEAMRRRVDHDLIYIGSWSLLLDLAIVVMTAREISRSNNAY
jgi:lipopolysaccharide/colanic/teichoic acid biosynthesis glycosyltransferase